MNEELQEIKNTYYDYVSNISNGCQVISNSLRQGNMEEAFSSIADFAEGLEWLLTVEAALAEQGLTINSRITEAEWVMIEINQAIEDQDFTMIADLFEYELVPIFLSTSEWIFTQNA